MTGRSAFSFFSVNVRVVGVLNAIVPKSSFAGVQLILSATYVYVFSTNLPERETTLTVAVASFVLSRTFTWNVTFLSPLLKLSSTVSS